MERTLKEYAKNCVYDLLNSYGALVTWDDLLYSPDLVDVFEQGAVNFKMTIVYTDEQSSQESCQSAWAVVRPYVTNLTNFQGSLERICTGDGFEWASAQERQVCLENLLETVAYYGGADYGEAAFLGQQTAMARILYEGLRDVEDADEVFQARVSQQAMTGGIGAFSTANEWFPIIRAVMCAVVISMVPFVFLFVATPLFGRALAVFFGLFSFVTVWGVVEVLMHSLAADYVFNMLASFRQDSFGFASIMSYPDACTKALGVFGLVRSSGMVLATLVTGIFVKVGTYELTQISGSIGGAIRERAERSASETATPLGRAELAKGLATSSGEMSLLEQASWQDRARAVVTESVFGYGSLLGRTETQRKAARDLDLGGDVRRLGSFSGQNAAAGDMG
jgi:conjugal transfer mating pair stabilization protein TraG